jgi:hypothetical protein
MQVSHVQFELSEALVHLQDFVAEIRDGKLHADDEPDLAVQLGHILDHISPGLELQRHDARGGRSTLAVRV